MERNANAMAGLKAFQEARAERAAVREHALAANRLPDPALIKRYALELANAEAVAFMAGDGLQAPGAIVTRRVRGEERATHFLNLQTGGFHQGDYAETYAEGLADFAARLARYDRTGGLREAADRQGFGMETVSGYVDAARRAVFARLQAGEAEADEISPMSDPLAEAVRQSLIKGGRS